LPAPEGAEEAGSQPGVEEPVGSWEVVGGEGRRPELLVEGEVVVRPVRLHEAEEEAGLGLGPASEEGRFAGRRKVGEHQTCDPSCRFPLAFWLAWVEAEAQGRLPTQKKLVVISPGAQTYQHPPEAEGH
jgi:8-oxo-dGTP pyrophosphatase MutT (NUDIX family)